jgi:transcriptional regulator with XRE-family HTH domain
MMPRGERLRAENGDANVTGERLRQRRKELNITQIDMIQRIEVATGGLWSPALQDYKRLEGGRRTCLDIETVCLAKILNCSAGWLLGDAEPEPIITGTVPKAHSTDLREAS